MYNRAEKAGVHRMGEIHRGKPKPLRPLKVVEKVVTDPSRDALLTEFGKTTLTDRYLLPGESYQDMFARVATAFRSWRMLEPKRRAEAEKALRGLQDAEHLSRDLGDIVGRTLTS